MRAAAAAFLLLPSLVAPLSSQSFDDPCPSRVVRWATSNHRVEGYLLAPPVAGQPLKVQQAGMAATPEEIGWDTPSLACRMQTSSKWGGAMIGLGLGVALGVATGYASGDDTHCWICFTAGEKAAYGAVGFGLIGAVVGAIAAPGSAWTPLNWVGDGQRIGLIANDHAVGVRVRF